MVKSSLNLKKLKNYNINMEVHLKNIFKILLKQQI